MKYIAKLENGSYRLYRSQGKVSLDSNGNVTDIYEDAGLQTIDGITQQKQIIQNQINNQFVAQTQDLQSQLDAINALGS